MGGKVEAIWTKPATGGVMEAAERAALVEAQGMEGDVNFGRKARQVTVIEKEVFDRLRAELPDARPVHRANHRQQCLTWPSPRRPTGPAHLDCAVGAPPRTTLAQCPIAR